MVAPERRSGAGGSVKLVTLALLAACVWRLQQAHAGGARYTHHVDGLQHCSSSGGVGDTAEACGCALGGACEVGATEPAWGEEMAPRHRRQNGTQAHAAAHAHAAARADTHALPPLARPLCAAADALATLRPLAALARRACAELSPPPEQARSHAPRTRRAAHTPRRLFKRPACWPHSALCQHRVRCARACR
jgi:hypothetical protein